MPSVDGTTRHYQRTSTLTLKPYLVHERSARVLKVHIQVLRSVLSAERTQPTTALLTSSAAIKHSFTVLSRKKTS
eukprot:1117778-Prymnesium_polylepis.1